MPLSSFRTAVLTFVLLLAALVPAKIADAADDIVLREWQMQWIDKSVQTLGPPTDSGDWFALSNEGSLTSLPQHARGVWIRTVLPAAPHFQQPALLVDRLYGHDIAVFLNGEFIYESTRDFYFELNKLLVPLPRLDGSADLSIRITSLEDRAGLMNGIRIGEFADLSKRFVNRELPDLLLGSGIVLLGLVMLSCVGYLNRKLRGTWLSLGLIALATGLLVITYSPLSYILFNSFGNLVLMLFDLCLLLVLPAFLYYVEQTLESRFVFFTAIRRFQTAYSGFCVVLMLVNEWTDGAIFRIFHIFTGELLSLLIVAEFLIVVALSVRHAVSGNKNALILSCGITFFTLSVVADLVLYYASGTQHVLWLWKMGVAAMLVSLVIILARRIAADHFMVVAYSKELEEYNVRMQRTEKLKIISELAASVAHEVRNPLQVTRGFLQLLSGKDHPNNSYYEMAITELDRAASIITDFLTFAKPEIDHYVELDLTDELEKIGTIMSPHASLNGVLLRIEAMEPIRIMGNSSKFKQAMMNFIKNSIEAIEQNGEIVMQAYKRDGEAVILINDNGGGMNKEDIAKLGVPYFSTKTKGTGLGLMVTFRIIEAMNGTITFDSEIGKGTEVTLRFPIADNG